MTFQLSRQQLYDVLWSAPLKQLRPALGVSDVIIHRTARRSNIPLPEPGHWMKKSAVKAKRQPPLPLPDLLTPRLIEFQGELTSELEAMFSGQAGVADADEPIEILAERLSARIGKLRIRPRGGRLHPAIIRMQERDLKRRWYRPIYTTPTGLRALAVTSALYSAAGELGCRPYTSTDYDDFTFDLNIGPIGALKMFIDNEGKKLSIGPAEERVVEGLGIQTFKDGEKQPLEDRLLEIFVAYAEQGERTRRKWRDEHIARLALLAESERKERERRQREQEQAQQQKLEEERLARINSAIGEATRWRDARLLREYSEAYLSMYRGEDAVAHAKWLQDVADQIDPLLKERSREVGHGK